MLVVLITTVLLASCWRAPPFQSSTVAIDPVLVPRSYGSVYVVKKGDTAYRIARCHGVKLRSLVAVNEMTAPYLITVGQRIKVPSTRIKPSCLVNTPSSSKQADTMPSNLASENFDVSLVVAPPALPVDEHISLRKPPLRAGSTFLWPVRGELLSDFGPKPGNRRNDGINISAPIGSPVRAAENGVVAYAGNELRGYGNLLLVRHDGGWVTAYAHNSELLVERGVVVGRGEVIARVGKSGNVDKPQAHFELRRGDEAVDPHEYLSWK